MELKSPINDNSLSIRKKKMPVRNMQREKILKIAKKEFLKNGKDCVRIRNIATKAKVNNAAIHYYFRSKEQLYQIVLSAELEKFFSDVFNSLDTNENIENFLRSFINNYIGRISKAPHIIRFISWEIGRTPELISKTINEIFREQGHGTFPFHEKIKDAIKDDVIRPVNPIHLVLNLMSMCLYPFLARPIISGIFPEIDFTSDTFLSERKKEIFNLIWNGVKKQ